MDKSLVVAEASPGAEGELRYRMLEPIRQYGQECLEESGEAEQVRERHGVGLLAWIQGDYERASLLLRESLRQGWESDNKVEVQTSLYGLAGAAALGNQPRRAAQLWGAVEGMQKAYGVHVTPETRSVTDYEGRLAAARSQLNEEAWSEAWAEGKAMPLGRAIEYALSDGEDDPPAPEKRPSADGRTGRLTRREQEVALLVTRGLTNRRISSELSISESTVENHVHKILKKLKFSSRARIAAWVAQQW